MTFSFARIGNGCYRYLTMTTRTKLPAANLDRKGNTLDYSTKSKARDARADAARKRPSKVRCSACGGLGMLTTTSLGNFGGTRDVPRDVPCDDCVGGYTEGLPDGEMAGMLAASVGLAKAGVRRFPRGGRVAS